MKKLLYALIVLLVSSVKIDAQDKLPDVFEITTDTIQGRVIFPDSCWQILLDSNSKWTIEQVNSLPIANKFLQPSPINTKPEFTIHTFWFRYRLINKMDKDVVICIPGGYDKDEIFIQDSSVKWHHLLSGSLQPWSKLDGFKVLPAIPVTIPAGKEILIYERLTSNNFFRARDLVTPDFIFEKDFVNENHGDITQFYFNAVFFSLIFGVLIFAALLNFVFFLMIRERVYLYFALFVASIGFMRYADEGFIGRIFFKEHPWIVPFVVYLAIPLLFFSLLQFTRYYLNTRKYFPVWNKFLNGLSIFSPVISIISLLISPILSYDAFLFVRQAAGLIYSLTSLTVLITFLLYIRRPERMVRFVIIAGLPMLLYWLTFVGSSLFAILLTKVFGLTEPLLFRWSDKWSAQIEQLCVAWFATFFTWILLLRFIQLRKEVVQQTLEKERLAKEREIERSQLIEQQKIELEKTVEERTAELKHSLNELTSTQAQLIQSEKMASLGELTAGIAHEIQNPLNFVNNFSEVSTELIDEMKDELASMAIEGNMQLVNEIANDLKQNLEKINHHGKRAGEIVKGMLQHSRTSAGQKEMTDINALCDEYLRLAYHGLRAKDKTFNAEMKTEFDETIGKINIVPQDIGRVVLNLITNAFYAVNEKKKSGVENYEPLVSIQTKNYNDKIEITVRDNGNGIPKNIVDKIFQPFFTTKPTGQGTGLGLSLSYDIIKAHGGEIKVETKEGEGTTFIIILSGIAKA